MTAAGHEYLLAGKYRLVEEIWSGHTRVWRALDPDDREVAVKIIPRPRGDTEIAKRHDRFRDEVEAGTALQGPHICQLLDHGEQEHARELGYPGGLFYLVLEYVSGGSLRERLANGPMRPPANVLLLARALARGLTTAHEHSPVIVHRDIKPENVLLPNGQLGLAKLADFGIARAEDGAKRTSVAGYGAGTYQYMAPEQFERSWDVGPAADQYSLTLLLWECLSGEVPLDEGDYVMTMVLRQKGSHPPLLEVDGKPVPATMRVLMQGMELDPEDRFESVGELVAQLEAAGDQDGLWEGATKPAGLPVEWTVCADHRAKGGALWLVADGATKDDLARVFGANTAWHLKKGAPAAGGRDAWWTKDAAKRLVPGRSGANPLESFPDSVPALLQPRPRRPTTAFGEPMTISATLAAVIGPGPYRRTEVTEKLWAYIKRHELQDAKDRRTIIADDNLKAVFAGRTRVNMFEMTKFVSKHLS